MLSSLFCASLNVNVWSMFNNDYFLTHNWPSLKWWRPCCDLLSWYLITGLALKLPKKKKKNFFHNSWVVAEISTRVEKDQHDSMIHVVLCWLRRTNNVIYFFTYHALYFFLPQANYNSDSLILCFDTILSIKLQLILQSSTRSNSQVEKV